MEKGAYIAMGFVPTIVAIYILSAVLGAFIDTDVFIYCIIFSSLLICLPTGIILIKKGYKNIGTGVIAGLISYYLFVLLLYWMMQGPM